MEGTYTAVVDRIEDGETAVILVEDEGDVVEQLDVPVDRLPDEARADGVVLTVTMADGQLINVEPRPEETSERREAMRDRLDRLSKRLSDRE